jgi:hypothetical protein
LSTATADPSHKDIKVSVVDLGRDPVRAILRPTRAAAGAGLAARLPAFATGRRFFLVVFDRRADRQPEPSVAPVTPPAANARAVIGRLAIVEQ